MRAFRAVTAVRCCSLVSVVFSVLPSRLSRLRMPCSRRARHLSVASALHPIGAISDCDPTDAHAAAAMVRAAATHRAIVPQRRAESNDTEEGREPSDEPRKRQTAGRKPSTDAMPRALGTSLTPLSSCAIDAQTPARTETHTPA